MRAPALTLKALDHVARNTKRLEETRRFYIDVMGFRELPRPPFSFAGAWLRGPGMDIHLIDEPYVEMPAPINTRENHIAFAVESVDAMEEVLRARGIAYKVNQTPGLPNEIPGSAVRQLFFRDPDGWLIEVGEWRW